MTEEEFIESRIQYWKDLRNRFIKHYQELDGVVDEETLSKVGDIITTAEQRIIELRKQLPSPMSQRQLRALEEIPKAWAEVTGKKDVREVAPPNEARKLLEEANKILNSDEKHLYRTELDEAERKLAWAGRIINQRFVDKTREEALCEAADKTLQEYADIAAGRILIDDDNVAHVHGTIETPRMVIEAAPRRTGRTFRNWLGNYFK